MNSKIEHSKDTSATGGDIVKYAVASLLVLAGLFVWFWFSADSGRAAQLGALTGQLRALAVVIGLAGGVAVFMLTGKGRDTREFLSESRFELRKVVWPTRQEAIRMTWVVMVVVIILSLLLGGFDYVIQWLVQLFLSR
ncbi:preprotein translocase subunit SecE [Stenotrophomonas sp.]|uniref:preprotein translocase subunit SecE n=1 Tax=Stenotrophomonas sp. TaxID=69392 RepID=UPI0028B1C532|nr:preprotein translocase subunit SecE [Stenotrophomonas sp.]